MGPATPQSTVAVPTPVKPGSINLTDTYWTIATWLTYEAPELIVKYEKGVRAGGRSIGNAPVPPAVLEGIGLFASVAPNAIQHFQQGEGLNNPEFWTDVVVDSGGWGVSLVASLAAEAAGGIVGEIAYSVGGGIPGALVGNFAGSLGGSWGYDIWIGPRVRPFVRSLVGRFSGY